jgi:hypothetical protein
VHYFNIGPQVKNLFGSCKGNLEDRVKIARKQTGADLVLSRPNKANRYNPEAGCCEKGNELSDFIKGG